MGKVEYQAEVKRIRLEYFGHLNKAVIIFEDALKHLTADDSARLDLTPVCNAAHKIKGNAAMYGFPDLGLRAKAVEDLTQNGVGSGGSFNTLLALVNLVDKIHNICDGEPDSGVQPVEDPSSKSPEQKTEDPVFEPPAPKNTVRESEREATFDDVYLCPTRKNILLAYQDPRVSDLLKSLLEQEFNFIQCDTAEETLEILANHKLDLAVVQHSLMEDEKVEFYRKVKMGIFCPTLLTFDGGDNAEIADAISQGITSFCKDSHDILAISKQIKDRLHVPTERVLIVDDDRAVRDLLKHILKSDGLQVDAVNDGIAALEYLDHETPDLIILDHFMPRLGGGTVLYEIQSKINLKSTPVLILTAMVNRGEAKNWFERGAADFIPKPFDPKEVSSRVKQQLEARRK